MKKYELVLLLDHEMKKDDRESFLSELESKLGKNVLEKDEIGLLDLRYELSEKKGKDRAYFVSYHLSLDNDSLAMIKQFLLYNKAVLRSAIYGMGEEEKFFHYQELNKKLDSMIESWGKQRFGQKVRFFSNDKTVEYLTWKALPILKKYVSRFGDIKPRAYTGNSISRQKQVRTCIIRAREMGLLEYVR
jgi:ribosomal protein S18/ribosomal protein S6